MKGLSNTIFWIIILIVLLVLIDKKHPDTIKNFGKDVRDLKDKFIDGYHYKDTVSNDGHQ